MFADRCSAEDAGAASEVEWDGVALREDLVCHRSHAVPPNDA
jgi:hypothetical protein